MLIGIDGNEANVINRVGSNIYSYEVINGLYEIRAKENENNDNYIIYLRDKPLADLPPSCSWWEYRVIKPRRFWTQVSLPLTLYAQKEKLDVFFSPGHYAPRFCPCPSVISILDTSYLSFPGYFKKDDLYQLKNWTSYSVKKAKKFLTISENSKKDIIKYYHRSPEDIIVVYPGYDYEKFNLEVRSQKLAVRKVMGKYNLSGDYIIYVGTLQPRKNLVRLIESFNQLNDQNKNLKLVIVGKKGWMYEEIFNRVKELNLENKVIFTGFVKDEELPYLIAGAKLYVLPSLYEGFGIPVVEAMAVGIPCVISKVSSLSEVGGKAAIYIDNPESVENIYQAITKGLNLNEKERDEIIKLGLEQVRKFNWKITAKQILEVLQNIKKQI